MNDGSGMTLTEDEVEERLRRTFATRVGDMGIADKTIKTIKTTGNGSMWRAIDPGQDGAVLPGEDHRRRRRLVLAVAATLLVAAGVAAAALAAVAGTGSGRDPGDRGTTGAADDPGASTSTTDPATTTTATTSAPSPDGSSCAVLAFRQGEDRWITMSFEATATDARDVDVPALLGDTWRAVEAGPNQGYIAEVPAGSPAAWLMFGDGIVRLQSAGVTADELTAVAGTVTRDPPGCYTASTPEGWSREEMPPLRPGREQAIPDGTFLGTFHDAAADTWYGTVWYPGWTRGDLPDDVENVTVSDGQAYIGTVAPDAPDLLQLWIVYDDGVVELQATRMSADDLRAAGDGVHRRPGTDDFDFTPPPGYARQE